MSPRGEAAHALFLEAQRRITDALAAADGGDGFRVDEWTREEGGGGRTMILADGPLIEKGGVNVSCVFGEMSEAFAKELPGEGRSFFATGVSLVIHPRSPHVPTVHANFRYLEKGEGDDRVSWFGGGADLTPWILYEEDAVHFHRHWKAACDRHGAADYADFKRRCDTYFHIPHRGESRGVGGIFFDYMGLPPPKGIAAAPDDARAFVEDCALGFVDAYLPIVERRRSVEANDEERLWQLRRRGRYVEFNLTYDRGTVFGLKTNGRVESILMSLPNLVRWDYDVRPEPGNQSALLDVLRNPRDWI